VISDETRQLLRWHAGLDGDPLDPLSVCGSLAAGHGLERALAELIEVMSRLNRELNGNVPSEAMGGGPDDPVPRDVAYAIFEVARELRDAAHVVDAWAVDVAWNAVLAGDIDDLVDHIEYERRTGPAGPIEPTR
jgi:hypothetical protein